MEGGGGYADAEDDKENHETKVLKVLYLMKIPFLFFLEIERATCIQSLCTEKNP
jgi:hypothetical protein